MNFKLEYYNKIGFDNYCDKSIFEKIDLLLNNNVFFVDENDWDNFISSVKSLNNDTFLLDETDDEKISRLPYLRINSEIANEIEQIVFNELFKSKGKVLDFELIEDYQVSLLTSINNVHKEKIINKYLVKTARLIFDTLNEDYPGFIDFNESLDENLLYKKIDFYYNDLLLVDFYSDPYYTGNSEMSKMPQKLLEDFISFKQDIITHVTAGGIGDVPPNCRMYKSACGFAYVHELLGTLEFFKKELKKLNHLELTTKKATGSNYSINNVLNNENRFPLVFKNAYSCELFLYTLSFFIKPKPIIFSYFFEIFKRQKLFKPRIKPSDYLDVINSVFGLNEIRIRKELSNIKDNLYINELIKRKKEFDIKISTKSTD